MQKKKRLWLGFGLLVLAGGGAYSYLRSNPHGTLDAAIPMMRPAARARSLTLPVLPDANPDPRIVEVSLTALIADHEYVQGRKSPSWTYNGTVPGPVIRARRGDSLVVNFKNELPVPTTIHWHGLRLPNSMDGSQRVMSPVQPGGAFRYEFTLLDAGVFWYHPHVRTDVQVARGLYGTLLVEDADEPRLPIATEEVVVLSSVLVDPTTGTAEERADKRAQMMGREGNLVLVNGRESNVSISARAGQWHRWRLVNASNARYFRLAFEGGRMVRIGGDVGLLERPEVVSDLILTPGERVDLLVAVPDSNQEAFLRALPYERASGAGATESVDLIVLRTSAEPAAQLPELPAKLREVKSLAGSGSPQQRLRFGERMDGERMVFTINDVPFVDTKPLRSTLGGVETWEIQDETGMDHPFHLHGFHFQVSGRREWKDTVNVPANGLVRLSVDFEQYPGASGSWMYHCHILEHEEGGMMGELEVAAPQTR